MRRKCSVTPMSKPHAKWSANCGQNERRATSGKRSGAITRRSRTAIAAAAATVYAGTWFAGMTLVTTSVQNSDTPPCTSIAARNIDHGEDSPDTIMVPTARIGGQRSPPVAIKNNVEGRPLNRVAVSHAQHRSRAVNLLRKVALEGTAVIAKDSSKGVLNLLPALPRQSLKL